jgi:hypothetical protein
MAPSSPNAKPATTQERLPLTPNLQQHKNGAIVGLACPDDVAPTCRSLAFGEDKNHDLT